MIPALYGFLGIDAMCVPTSASVAILVALCVVPSLFVQEKSDAAPELVFRMSPSEENVVASELIGEWVVDEDLKTRLGGRSDHLGNGPVTFSLSKDAERRIIAFLNETISEALAEKPDEENREALASMQTLYLAGEVEFNGNKQDFALTSVYGTPRILLYDREGDMESENVMLARDEKGESDLLFLGGDFNNQSFGAYKRVVKKTSESDE